MNACDDTTVMVATVVAAHRQHSATTVAMMPLGAGPEATLEATYQLLHNPPGPACLTIDSRVVAS
jgi:hypothetical protein